MNALSQSLWLFALVLSAIIPILFRDRLWLRFSCVAVFACSAVWSILRIYVAGRVALNRISTDYDSLRFADGCYAMQDVIRPCLPVLFLSTVGLTILALLPSRDRKRNAPNATVA